MSYDYPYECGLALGGLRSAVDALERHAPHAPELPYLRESLAGINRRFADYSAEIDARWKQRFPNVNMPTKAA